MKKISKTELAEREYKYALSLLQYHTQLLWQEFGTFFLAETIFISFIGNNLSETNPNYILIFIGAIVGFIICFPWQSTFLHNYEYYKLRMAQARQHEKTLGLSLLTQGQTVADGKEITINSEQFKHPELAIMLRPHRAVNFLISLFWLAFSILIFYAGIKILTA